MVSITTTITTPINFITYAQSLSTGDPSRTFVENMVNESDVMRTMMVMPADRGKKAFMDIGSLPSVGFRGLNEIGGQALGDFNLREEDTFFIDEYIHIDRAMIDRLGQDGRYKQENLKSIALAQYFSQNVVKGDNSSNPRTPNGLQSRCNNVGINLIQQGGSGGTALSLANLDKLYWLVNKPSHWIFPRGLMPFVDIAARSNSLTNQTFSADTDNLGRNIRKYKNLPILYGYDPDDSPDLLPFTEVSSGGGGAVTSSIYLVNFTNGGGFYAIEQTPLSVMPEGPIPGSPFESTHVKWDWGLVREHPRAIARLQDITAATIVA